MATELTIAVVGPAGLVGREILELLGQRQFPVGSIRLLGTHRTAGAEVELAGRKEEIALVVPEVNVGKLGEWRERGIVASPSGTATALGVVLGALAEAGLRRVVVSSYQGVASAGRRAV